MAQYVSTSKKKKRKKKKNLQKHADNFHLVVDLDKALTSGGTPANPALERLTRTGVTSEADGHTHTFNLQSNNGVVTGSTNAVNGHIHLIEANTGGQSSVRIPTGLNIPTAQTQFVEGEGNAGNGVPVTKREGDFHTHSVSVNL